MTQMLRAKLNWTGFTGAPGYTNLFFRDFTEGPVTQEMADGAKTKLTNFMASLGTRLPSTVTLSLDSTMDIIEDTTGQLQGFMTIVPPAATVGSVAGAYSAASGACITWNTNGVRNGRRVRGRTFIVPLGGTIYDTDGTIATTHLTAFRTAATDLTAASGAGDLGVWARPSAPGASDGAWWVATGGSVRDKVAVLTSRRD
jgi:hypothetical protein